MKYQFLSLFVSVCVSIICSLAMAETEMNDQSNSLALFLLNKMTLEEKIGQKLILDFRNWCDVSPIDSLSCTQDMTVVNESIKKIISDYHIGGIILFSNNLKDIPQIVTLTDALQQTMRSTNNLPLLIGTDQEGGIVFRLPANVAVTFAGNMAIAAGYSARHTDVSSIANVLGINLKALGINVDFAPDVDVNSNPQNPIINVRSFSDDPNLVAELGAQFTKSLQQTGISATLKHFPGHGDTSTDSHTGLPLVSHQLKDANQLDLYPFKEIIQHQSPDLIMTAHIQFPALDDTKITTKTAEEIYVPATLSRKIQTDLLRHQLGFQGILITDALDMAAIVKYFEPADAVIKAFKAGDDIALMPVKISNPNDLYKLPALIDKIKIAVNESVLSKDELDQSVLRVIKLKLKLGLMQPDTIPLQKKIEAAESTLHDPSQKILESISSDAAETLVQNKNGLLPLTAYSGMRIHILTPWLEQAAGIKKTIEELTLNHQLPSDMIVTMAKITETNLMAERNAVDNADIVIVGNSTTVALPSDTLKNYIPTRLISNLFSVFPQGQRSLAFPAIPPGDGTDMIDTSESSNQILFSANYVTRTPTLLFATPDTSSSQFVYQVLSYAKQKGKKTIFISLHAPYDLANYNKLADAMLALYDFYGYLEVDGKGYFRGPMMPALTRVLFGISKPQGTLPVNVPDPDNYSNIIYKHFGQ